MNKSIKLTAALICLCSSLLMPNVCVNAQSKKISKQDILNSQQLFDDALKVRMFGDLISAENSFRALIEKYPFNDGAYYELSRILNDRNMFADAKQEVEKAIQYNPKNKWYRILYAEILSSNGEYNSAVKAWKDVVAMEPDNIEYYNELAIAYVEADSFRKAIGIYDDVEKKFGVSEEFSIKKHKIWMAMNNFPKAVAEIKRLVDAFPFQTKYRAQLAELYVAMKQDDLALEQYKKIAQLNPEDEYIHITLSDFYRKRGDREKSWEELKKGFANPKLSIETKMNVIKNYSQSGTTDEEIEQQLSDMIKVLATAHADNPFVLNLYAETLAEDGDIEGAKNTFYKSIAIDSTNYEVMQRLMFLEWDSQNTDESMKIARRLTTLVPVYPISYLFLGMGYMVKEQYEEAIKELESGIKFVGNDNKLLFQFYMYIGDCYHQSGNDSKTFEYYDKCLQLEPDNAYILNNYAYFLSNHNDRLQEAKAMSEKAIEYDPNSSAAMDTYGWILYKLGNYAAAEEWIRKAIAVDKSNSSEVLEHLGDVLYKQGLTDQAVEQWEKASNANGKKGEKLDIKINDRKLYE